MLDKQPLVSLVIPCYNHEKFVKKSVQSIIDQSYKNIELIIIDDGSKDNSVNEILKMVPLCEERFTSFEFRYRENKGLSATLNEAILWSNGDYWAICSSDDYFHEDKILEQINFFKENNDISFCVTKLNVVDDNDILLEESTLHYNRGVNTNISFGDLFTFKVTLPITGVYGMDLIKTSLGGFDENLVAEDYDINLRIASNTEIGLINKNLFFYRSPAALGSDRKRPTMKLEVSESHLKTINKYSAHELYDEAIRNWNYRRFIAFSSYYQTKFYAFKGMLNSMHKFNDIYFYRSIVKLIFIWKDYNAK